MKYFSMPADFKKETLEDYEKLNNRYPDSRVIETYGNITRGNFLESSRSINFLPEINFAALEEYIAYSREKNIRFDYTLNALHMHNMEFSRQGVMEIINFLGKLYRVGVRHLTVALPSLVEIIQSTDFDFNIKASVITQVTNAEKARFCKEMGIDKIVIDESVNRDFQTLKRIRDTFGENIEIIVNSICHKNCTYRMFHYGQIACDSVKTANQASTDYYNHKCLLRRYKNSSALLKMTWVRPEDIKFYTAAGINYFKIQGRHTVEEGDPVRAVECYFNESFDGDLLELLDLFNPTTHFKVSLDNRSLDGFIEPFVRGEHFCKNHCSSCGYCERFARKCLDAKEINRVSREAAEYFRQCDQFQTLLQSIKTGGNHPETKTDSFKEIEADFDLN